MIAGRVALAPANLPLLSMSLREALHGRRVIEA